MVRRTNQESAGDQIHIVLNWSEELNRLAPVDN